MNNKLFFFGELVLFLILSVSLMSLVLLRAKSGSPTFDEFYHLLAARSWATDGTLAIAGGSYNRAWLFTKAVGISFAIFGESVSVARIVPAVGAVAWLLVIFLWAHLYLGRAIAWVAVLLLQFSHEFLNFAVNIRFYSWHGFFVFLGFFLITTVFYSRRSLSYRLVAGIFAIASLKVAFHLQPTTVIAILGIGTWLVAGNWSKAGSVTQSLSKGKSLWLTIPILIFAAVSVAASGILLDFWNTYTHSALWNVEASILTYFWFWKGYYPAFWALFPFAAVAAAMYRPPFGLACVIIFIVAFLLHTFGGMRHIRYLLYAFPYFFIVCSIALVSLSQWLYRELSNFSRTTLDGVLAHHRVVRGAWVFVIILTVPAVIINNDGAKESVRIMAGMDKDFRAGEDWSEFNTELARIAGKVKVVVVTYGVAGIYYLGDIDFVLSRTIMLETDTGKEFGFDRRIGRNVISSVESLKLIWECNSAGMLVADIRRLGTLGTGADAKAMEFIQSNMQPVDGLRTDNVKAFTWEHHDVSTDVELCMGIWSMQSR